MRAWWLAIAILGCGKPAPEIDCAAIRADPAHALDAVTSKTGDPARVWGVLEDCFAPGGDPCARAAVGGQITPGMAVSDGSQGDAANRAAGWRRWTELCRGLPAAQQRCLQVSYAIGHPACAKLAAEVRAKLDQAWSP